MLHDATSAPLTARTTLSLELFKILFVKILALLSLVVFGDYVRIQPFMYIIVFINLILFFLKFLDEMLEGFRYES